jgi:hypothetical protein
LEFEGEWVFDSPEGHYYAEIERVYLLNNRKKLMGNEDSEIRDIVFKGTLAGLKINKEKDIEDRVFRFLLESVLDWER